LFALASLRSLNAIASLTPFIAWSRRAGSPHAPDRASQVFFELTPGYLRTPTSQKAQQERGIRRAWRQLTGERTQPSHNSQVQSGQDQMRRRGFGDRRRPLADNLAAGDQLSKCKARNSGPRSRQRNEQAPFVKEINGNVGPDGVILQKSTTTGSKMHKEGRDDALTIREMSREQFVGEKKSSQASPTNQRTVQSFQGNERQTAG
jgi:hypothetical protein